MSAAPAKTADPSMEEILASIRRIIADDDEPRPATDAPGTSEAAAVEPPPDRPVGEPPREEAVSEAAPTPVSSVEDDEVLDLAEASPARPAPRASLAIEGPDLPREPVPERNPPEPVREAPAAASAAVGRAPRPPAQESRQGSEGLISAAATSSVGQAFNLLSHTIMSQNAHTLEDIVREMLRPMLKTWLDDNLPPLVERLVAAEIERVARGRR